ncbi:hypothetical protein [Levilactobacillus paucivorans]|uniref:hypothetical protein n=1 Tax=Levilactobacillus paucivorans TaxID=616990 RepID=UPI0012EEC982|nr:hypothetical protein [Levilactobacillus paucivorans]
MIEREICMILREIVAKESEFHQIIMKNDRFFRFFGAKDTGKKVSFWLKWVKIGRLKRFILQQGNKYYGMSYCNIFLNAGVT